jgi:L-fuconolactonase
MLIDSHQHFWDIARFSYDWMSPDSVLHRTILPDDLRPHLSAAGIHRTVLVEAHGSLEETDWFLELAEANDFIAGVVAWVDLLAPGLPDRLDMYAEHPSFKGVRHKVHDEPNDDWLARSDVHTALDELACRDIPYDLLVRPQHLRHVPRLAARHPDLRMVVDHIAKPRIAVGDDLASWSRDMKAVADIPTISCKLSGMVTEADHAAWKPSDLTPYVDAVVEMFGFNRLMFGSDWPVCELASDYGRTLDALRHSLGSISASEEAAVMGGTATCFYNLEA